MVHLGDSYRHRSTNSLASCPSQGFVQYASLSVIYLLQLLSFYKLSNGNINIQELQSELKYLDVSLWSVPELK